MKGYFVYPVGALLIVVITFFLVFKSSGFYNKEGLEQAIFTPKVTQPSPYVKVDDLEGVLLKTTEGTYANDIKEITFEFINETDSEYTYGEEYHLEKLENGEWYQLSQAPSEYDRGWNAIGYMLLPNSTSENTLNLEWIFGNHFDSGRYRIVKDILSVRKPGDYDKFYLTAEFDIINE